MQLMVELVRRGATLLKEPCAVCGGVQVRYHGKVIFTNHDDLSGGLTTEEGTYEAVAPSLRTLLLSKAREAAHPLEKEPDALKEDRPAPPLTKNVELRQ